MTEAYPPSARVRRRADYRRIQASRSRVHSRHFLVVILPGPGQRLGITVTKKIGNAVVRNRARRRLKEAARLTLARCGTAGWDYVAVARASTPDLPFNRLVADFETAAAKVAPKS